MERIVLAYSGGLQTSAAIAWLAERFSAEVVTVTIDLGQGRDLADIRERALAAGAVRAHILDAREEFARQFILPSLEAGALYEGQYPLATALGRPLIARKLVEVARIEGAPVVAHGCAPDENDRIRLEVGIRALDPGVEVIAPSELWGLRPEDLVAYAMARGLTVPASVSAACTIDANLWGRSIQGPPLEDLWHEPPEDLYALTRASQHGPDEPAYIEIEFDAGVPLRANGIEMGLIELIESVETIAGAHGVGRIDMVENRVAGTKSREIYEAPAAVLLHAAHRELEKLVIPRELERLKRHMAAAYADLVYNGLWFSPTRDAIDAFVASIQPRVTGAVRLKLLKGGYSIVGRRSPFALHDTSAAPGDSTALDQIARGAR
jgi:argininosuccinate synthase